MKMKEQILSEFTKRFEGTPVVYASSGRINLIGEHTDYNGGFVFPGAIDKYIMAAILPNGSDKVRVFSIDINDYAEFGLNEEDAPEAQWARYIFGVCRETIKRDGTVEGFDAVFAVGRDGELAIAAEGDGRAVLALNDGVFGIFVFRGSCRHCSARYRSGNFPYRWKQGRSPRSTCRR